MTTSSKKELNQNLIDKYFEYKEAYYSGQPLVSDEEFDAFELQLVDLGFDPKVGTIEEINDSEKIEHGQKMLSLNKIQILEDEMLFDIAKSTFSKYNKGKLSWKYDGLAINVRYKNGKLVSASTRGNGTFGRNVLYKLKSKLPETISFLKDVELRFEAVMPTETFIKKYSSDYAHPRNLVAGIVRDENANDSRIEDFDLVLLEVIEVDNSTIILLDFDKSFPEFPIKADFEIINDMYELREAYNKMYNSRSDYKYPTDGLVYASLTKTVFKHNGHHPEHAISIKFKPPRLISTIEKITWKLHRTGNWKPIIWYTPIVVDGRLCKKASGYNMRYIVDNNMVPGKQVELILSNDIIPTIRKIENS